MSTGQGETDLEGMLASLDVTRRPGVFTFVESDDPTICIGNGVEAVLREDESITLVVSEDAAARNGWKTSFRAAWLTLTVHSALEAIGLTAAFAAALTAEGISCNVIAGFRHDHLLVPIERVDDATAAIRALASRSS